MLLLVGQLRLDGSRDSMSRRVAPSRRQLRLAMRSISMQFRQLLLVGQHLLDGSSESAAQGIITSEIKDGFAGYEPLQRRTVSMNLHGVCRSTRPTSR